MKNKKIAADYNKKRGSRLKECRDLRNLTQEDLAEAAHVSSNYISMLERGERTIDWNKANEFAEILDVSANYIMCKSDIAEKSRWRDTFDLLNWGPQDLLLLKYLLAAGNQITFHIVRLYDNNKEPVEREWYGQKYWDYTDLQESVTLDQLDELCLSDATCKLIDGNTKSEVVIVGVTVNRAKLTYGEFVFTINTLTSYMNYTLHCIGDIKEDHDSRVLGMDGEIYSLIIGGLPGSIDNIRKKEAMKSGDPRDLEKALGLPEGSIILDLRRKK